MRLRRIIVYALLLLASAVALLPFVFLSSGSLKTANELRTASMLEPPRHPTLAAWTTAWSSACETGQCKALSKAFAQSVQITTCVVIVSVALGAVTGFALVARGGRWGRILFAMLVMAMFVPPQVLLYPMVVITRSMGLFGTFFGLVLIHVVWGLPLVTLLFRNFYLSLSPSLLDAAKLDGADFLVTFWNILLPLSWPTVLLASVLQFTFVWNDMLMSITFGGRDFRPITVALTAFSAGQSAQDYNVAMASAMIASIPTMLLYALAAILLRQAPRGASQA